MANQEPLSPWATGRNSCATGALLAMVLVLLCILAQSSPAQTFTVMHAFTGGADGASPYGSLTLDRAGNLYGTATAGGYTGNGCSSQSGVGCGTVFKMTRSGSSWLVTPLYSFRGNPDAATPYSGVTIGPNGSLYGTTIFGGGEGQLGTIYNLQPPAHATGNVLGGWVETVIYRFSLDHNGYNPAYGNLVFDPAGNIYGTTYQGGSPCGDGGGCGTVFKLTPSGAGWTISSFDFMGIHGQGGNPLSGVVLDASGNLYGTTSYYNFDPMVYQLSPSGSGWNEITLYTFAPSDSPQGGVILDGLGNLFGTTLGTEVPSTVYQLSDTGAQWNYSLLYNFNSAESAGPESGVVRDASGNLYGTTCGDGTFAHGSVFKLTPTQSGWTETDLHDFTGGDDGDCPVGGLALDATGNIYGTTSEGGEYGNGVVFEITP